MTEQQYYFVKINREFSTISGNQVPVEKVKTHPPLLIRANHSHGAILLGPTQCDASAAENSLLYTGYSLDLS